MKGFESKPTQGFGSAQKDGRSCCFIASGLDPVAFVIGAYTDDLPGMNDGGQSTSRLSKGQTQAVEFGDVLRIHKLMQL